MSAVGGFPARAVPLAWAWWGIATLLLAACTTPAPRPTPSPAPTTFPPALTAPLSPTPLMPPPAGQRELVLMTHSRFHIRGELLREFELRYNVRVQVLKSGDAGAALERAIQARGAPLADVFFGVDNALLGRALREDLFEPYRPQGIEEIPNEFLLDPEYRLIPISYGDVCVNYDPRYFRDRGLRPPEGLEDLARPEYRGLLVVEDPAVSSPGLAFLVLTIVHFGEEGWRDFWRALKVNAVKIVKSWEDAYYKEFSGATEGRGRRPLVVGYAASPAAEAVFRGGELSDPPVGTLRGRGACFRQIEFAGILKGARNRDLAERWIDMMIGLRFQEDIPLQMFAFPVHPKARLPEVFRRFVEIPLEPVRPDPGWIEANRERWIQEWNALMGP